MELILSHPGFQGHLNNMPACKMEVYADEDRHHVTVMIRLGRQHDLLDPHQTINAFYRQVLFRHLTPASSLKFYCVTASGTYQHVQLEGLPGGYTGGQLMPCLSLPAAARSMTA